MRARARARRRRRRTITAGVDLEEVIP